ncbi:MAG: sialate O-acetylesterase [Rhodothermales bacterium]
MRAFSKLITSSLLILMLGVFTGCTDPETLPYSADEKPLHLYLLAGQSNMAGRGQINPDQAVAHPNVYALQADMSWGLAKDPLHFDKPTIVGVGPGMSFGIQMAASDPSVRIGLIPTAVGGSPIKLWTPGGVHEPTNTRPYDDALSRTFRVLALQGGTLKGIIWHQGESDRDNVEGYEEALVALVDRFRQEFQVSDLPFVAAHLAPYYTTAEAGAILINAAIDQLPNHRAHTAVVSAEGLQPKDDKVHLDTPSSRELGQRYAAAMLKLQKELAR